MIADSTIPCAAIRGERAPNARCKIAWSTVDHLNPSSMIDVINSQLKSPSNGTSRT